MLIAADSDAIFPLCSIRRMLNVAIESFPPLYYSCANYIGSAKASMSHQFESELLDNTSANRGLNLFCGQFPLEQSGNIPDRKPDCQALPNADFLSCIYCKRQHCLSFHPLFGSYPSLYLNERASFKLMSVNFRTRRFQLNTSQLAAA